MLIVLSFIAIWFLLGCLGSYLGIEFLWRRGTDPMDVTVDDMYFFGFMACLGPLNLLCGISFMVEHFVKKFYKIDPDRVILKKKDRK